MLMNLQGTETPPRKTIKEKKEKEKKKAKPRKEGSTGVKSLPLGRTGRRPLWDLHGVCPKQEETLRARESCMAPRGLGSRRKFRLESWACPQREDEEGQRDSQEEGGRAALTRFTHAATRAGGED